ncbi:MAG TPA: hypothetical protein VG737_02130 [Cyclobacteriaceae bacterium]|nr:hypothetical protein [Cyclobacteriaceae bacterium]
MIKKGIIAGIAFGILDILPMLMMQFNDKVAAVSGAFISRFAIGLLIFTADLGISRVASGLLIGLMLSIPDALITRNYGPILGSGIVGGVIIGYIASRYTKK